VQLQVHRASARDQYVAISHVWADGLGNPKSNALPECQLRRLAKYLAELPNPSSRNADDGSRSLYSFGPLSVRIDIGKLKVVYRPSNPCMLFWMDTLCIPVARDENDTEVWELKRQAIDQMASIYSGASHVGTRRRITRIQDRRHDAMRTSCQCSILQLDGQILDAPRGRY
jgi:hypothetical protein